MANKRGQGLSITTIVVAAIALIVLVVLVAIFTGRLGAFSKGVSETITCENSCKAFGMKFDYAGTRDQCESDSTKRYVPGEYSDLARHNTGGSKVVCCCKPE